MTKSFAPSLLLLIPLAAACGKSDSKKNDAPAPSKGSTQLVANPGLLGTWGTLTTPITNDRTGAREGEIRTVFTIGEGTMTVANTCQMGRDLSIGPVSVTVAANLTDDSIVILANKEDSLAGQSRTGKGTCSVGIQKGTVRYTLQGDALRLTSTGDKVETMDLHRL